MKQAFYIVANLVTTAQEIGPQMLNQRVCANLAKTRVIFESLIAYVERNRTDFEMIGLAFDAFYAIFSTANDLKMVQIAFE